MTPVEPEMNPPFQSIVDTLGFHSPHVDMSDQIRQTLSAEAVVSTEVPYSRAIDFPSQAADELVRRSRGTSTIWRVLRKLRDTTPATNNTAPTTSIVRRGAPRPTGAGREKIRNNARG